MLEAVNSVLQTAPMIRGNAEQVSNAASFAANPTSVQKIPLAPYISPYIHMDVDQGAVLQIRDSDTGDVVRQIPSEASIEARQRFQQQIDLLQQQAQSQTEGTQRRNPAAGNEGASLQAASSARSANVEAAPQQQQQAARPAPAPAAARQIAAFVAASQSGASANSGVQLFA